MGHGHTKTLTAKDVTLPSSSLLGKLGLPLLVIGLGLSFGAMAMAGEHKAEFGFKYLTSYMTWLSVALGGLFFVIIHHVTRAGWSTVVRRLAENFMIALPVFLVLFIPIYMNLHDIYEWTHTDVMEADSMLSKKMPYLNEGAFRVRLTIIFGLWTALALFFYRASTKMDETGDAKLSHKMRWWAPLSIVAFALTVTAAAVDWMMSLDPHFFSTIFGVYYFAGTAIVGYGGLILAIQVLRKGGHLDGVITTEHDHDLGKLMFGFVAFWSYVAFSQYLLIWYANSPEETYWFRYRWELCPTDAYGCVEEGTSPWATLSLVQIFGHFVIPFFFLMSRHIKRRGTTITLAALFLLVIHYLDMYWLIQPVLDYHHHLHPAEHVATPMHGPHFSVLDVMTFVGIGSTLVGVFLWRLKAKAMVPLKDPRLDESLAFENYPTL